MPVWVSIRPLEPLLLRGPGEFDPGARGAASIASSLPWPRPTTFAGLLASLYYKNQKISGDWLADFKLIREILSNVGIAGIRGPYLVVQNEVLLPIMDKGLVLYRQSGEKIKPEFEERIGLGLKVRETSEKVAEEGLLYTVRYLRPPKHSEFRYLLLGEPEELPCGPVKFGGEHRMALLSEAEPIEVTESDKAVLVSPLVSPDLQTIMKKKTIIVLKGKIESIGLGYSLRLRRRRPILPAVQEGSVIQLPNPLNIRDSLYPSNNPLGFVGFGSILPCNDACYKIIHSLIFDD